MGNHFVLGNTFDTATMHASHDVFWSLGPLRGYHLFHLSSSWISDGEDEYKSLAWFLHKCSAGTKPQLFKDRATKRARKIMQEEMERVRQVQEALVPDAIQQAVDYGLQAAEKLAAEVCAH